MGKIMFIYLGVNFVNSRKVNIDVGECNRKFCSAVNNLLTILWRNISEECDMHTIALNYSAC